jgi:type III pantothenate kinase
MAFGRSGWSASLAAYDRSMLLAVDIGNTNVTAGLFRAGTLVAARRAVTEPRITADELELLLDGLLRLDGGSLAEVSSMACCSVVPSLTATLEAVAGRRRLPLVIASAGTVPLPVRVDRPSEVGADRLVNALAVARIHGAPAIVVDFGTATTFDCVAADGAYIGGAIAPGLELGLEALASRTAQLPRIDLRSPDRAIGRNTVAAMQSGTIFGYQALVGGLLERLRRELAEVAGCDPAEVKSILTGGLAAAPWAADLPGIAANDPNLTLTGLAILHAEVSGGERLPLGLG